MSESITQREFARRKGVHLSTVQSAIKSGRIVVGADKKIDWESQAVAWDVMRDTAKVRANAPAAALAQVGVADLSPKRASATPTLADARLAKEMYNAKLRELEYQRGSGVVIDKELVRTALFRFCRDTRDQILNIPDRVSASVAAEIAEYLEQKPQSEPVSPDAIERIVRKAWDKESRHILERLTYGPKIGAL
jgi:phage terminase Nu1 subunit (DNA packaging protein)